MDTLDINLKTAAGENTAEVKNQSGSTEKSSPAPINANATASYIGAVSKNKGLLTESQSRTFTQLTSSLNSYIQNQGSIDRIDYDADSAQMGHYRKLAVQVINRDPVLQEKVASDLSSSSTMVRSRDAAVTLENNLKNLPKALSEGCAAGQTLGKFICQSVVNLTDYENMGAGLQRDLAIRQVFAPSEELSARTKAATEDVLAASIAYVKSNQPEVLSQLKSEQEIVKTTPGSTTPQIMTRYLRQALNEFPEDSTYLDIFKQNRQSQKTEDEFEDEISKATSKRIHDLIVKAAQIARKGNLLSDRNIIASESANNTSARNAQENAVNQNSEEAPESVSKLSLTELSARAAKLQQKFREERIRLASEGKLPDPAPKAEVVKVSRTMVDEVDAQLEKNISQSVPRDTALDRTTQAKESQISAEEIKKLALDAVREALKETVKSQIEASQNTAKQAATEAVSALKETILTELENTQNTTKEVAAKAVREALEQNTKSQLEATQTSALEAATKAVSSLKESILKELEANANSSKENAANAVRDALARFEESQNQAKAATTSAVEELKKSVSEQLARTNDTAKEAAAEAVKAALIENAKTQSEATKNSAKEAATEAVNVLKEKVLLELEENRNSVKEALKESVKAQFAEQNLSRSEFTPSNQVNIASANISFRGTSISGYGSYELTPGMTIPVNNNSGDILEIAASDKTKALVQEYLSRQENNTQIADEKAALELDKENLLMETESEDKDVSKAQMADETAKAISQTDAEQTKTDAKETLTDVKVQKINEQTAAQSALTGIQSSQSTDSSPDTAFEPSSQLSDITQSNAQTQLTGSAINLSTDTLSEVNANLYNATTFSSDDSTADSQFIRPSAVTVEEKAVAFSSLMNASEASQDDAHDLQKSESLHIFGEDDIFNEDHKIENTDVKTAVMNRPSVLSGLTATSDTSATDNTAPLTAKDASRVNSANQTVTSEVERRILTSTVPSMELEDSVIPSDTIRSKDTLQKSDNDDKKSDDADITITKIPDKTPGAAAITQGQSEPIPEESVIESVSTVKEKTGLFSKIASIFGKKQSEESVSSQESKAAAPLNLNNMMTLASKGSPLDNLMYSLKVQMNNPALPDTIRKEAKNFLEKLQNPIDDLPAVSNWLNFTTGPLSPTSPQALALHQWAFMLLSIRFSQLGKSVDKFLKKSADLMEDRFDSDLEKLKGALNKDGKKLISSLLDETLDQISRYQNPAKENLPLLYQYIPLPPAYDGGREGGFNARPVVEEDGKKAWHLNFVFDLKELGPIEIKAEAKLPELKLSVVASTFAGLQKVQECLPDLKAKLQDLGITTRSSTARMGKVHIRERERLSSESAKKNDGSSLSVDI
ncbi:MAG: hypothetical protein ACI4UM_02290 [Succinivibrio sp.]